MSPLTRKLTLLRWLVIAPLLACGIFSMCFWMAWERGSKSFDHGAAELMLNMASRLMSISAALSIGSFVVTFWALRNSVSLDMMAKDRPSKAPPMAIIFSGTLMAVTCGAYAGLTYAVHMERAFSLAPYADAARITAAGCMMLLLAADILVVIAARNTAAASSNLPN